MRAARWRPRQALPRWRGDPAGSGGGGSRAGVWRRRRRGGGDAAAARGESLGMLVMKLRMDGGEMYAPNFAKCSRRARPKRPKPQASRWGRDPAAGWADSAGPGSIRTATGRYAAVALAAFVRVGARPGEPHPQLHAGAAAARLRRRGPRRLHASPLTASAPATAATTPASRR